MSSQPPTVSIVIPVKNEELILERCLDSIDQLDYPKDRVQVIIADGLSTDGSREIAARRGAQVVCNPRQTVVAGRNLGFQVANGEYIVFTDADCVVRNDWLRGALDAFRLDKTIAGVGGVSLFPENATPFEEAVNLVYSSAELAESTAHPQSSESDRYVDDLPGCNAMYYRDALGEVMPVDEQLLTAEDVWMNWTIRQRGHRLLLTKEMVLWHQRRSSPKRFFRQIYRFAIGRLQVGRRARSLLNSYHIFAAISLPLLVILAAGTVLTGHALSLLIALSVLVAVSFGMAALKTNNVRAAMWFPPVLAIFLSAWSLGFFREWAFPLTKSDGK